MDLLVGHELAQDAFATVLANISAAQLGAPTPCSEWAIGDLIEHVLSGNELVACGIGVYEKPPNRPDNLLDAHRATAAAAQQAFTSPGAMDAIFELPIGPVPGRFFLPMRAIDVLTHAWDLAIASSQSVHFDPELAATQLAAARQLVQPEFRGPGRPFGEPQPCAADRAPADQLAAFLGRKVD
ncbi:TIGR03086 family metal-binding protein [Mycobacterium shimoidei]|uniref:Mycothiol-dependent maleylpyruvate isomerase metal-binding domain-containing protein n=1 Tax=Mycobacterium shimoidei TaxID=29313 RepID=A0A1E3T3B5_MYCSH|nr:TIGR03086 family metal-binding protein [Mycobacterium shimoidei]MCV7258201.1 TIGR03086 family protein [Mycobacterium shimoidei]ODR08935.1 TIGR03086 family protein [Mycobacterium shimoidei]ORW82314.1 hypothetical protein AWC26_05100 [Mycobacterium shimoidei]SRX95558.1 hypothetical protein [Thermobispora bispora DSM 43833] [Mycobacterium shimoidei]